jgi:hypothetical protein
VQIAVVPWVQARTRLRERWEDDLHELANLLEEQLPRAVSRFRSDADTERVIRDFDTEPDIDRDRLVQELRKATATRRESQEIVDQHRACVTLLADRLRRVHRRAPCWQQTQVLVLHYRFRLGTFTWSGAVEDDDDDEWRRSDKAQEDARKRLLEQLEPIVATMKPPPQQTVRRWRQRVMTRVRKDWMIMRSGTGAAAQAGDS